MAAPNGSRTPVSDEYEENVLYLVILISSQGLSRVRDGVLVTELDLNLQQQIRDKWCFQVQEHV